MSGKEFKVVASDEKQFVGFQHEDDAQKQTELPVRLYDPTKVATAIVFAFGLLALGGVLTKVGMKVNAKMNADIRASWALESIARSMRDK